MPKRTTRVVSYFLWGVGRLTGATQGGKEKKKGGKHN